MGEFRMPSLGADMEEGTIVEWRVHPGDHVRKGDVVAVIDTDKSDIDAEVFEDGVIGDLLVAEGETVPVGTVLATLVGQDGEGEAATPPVAAAPAVTAPAVPPPVSRPVHHPAARTTSPLVRHLAERLGVDLATVHGTGPGRTIHRVDVEAAARAQSRPLASPRARRLASVAGVDLSTLVGTGPAGAVVGVDVEGAAPAPAAPRTRDRTASMRRRTAELMERSNREIPHYWVTRDLDLSATTAWLEDHNAGREPRDRLVAAALLLAATARAATGAPGLNGHWVDGDLVSAASVDLGLIVVLRTGGLLVPTIPEAERLTATEVMAAMVDLVRRARSGHLRSSDLRDASLTVSNLGDQGADAVLGTIYPPQVALIGFGRVVERPWAEGGMLGIRPVVTASVAGDHRASEGHQASRFLADVDQWLQDPDRLEEAP